MKYVKLVTLMKRHTEEKKLGAYLCNCGVVAMVVNAYGVDRGFVLVCMVVGYSQWFPGYARGVGKCWLGKLVYVIKHNQEQEVVD